MWPKVNNLDHIINLNISTWDISLKVVEFYEDIR